MRQVAVILWLAKLVPMTDLKHGARSVHVWWRCIFVLSSWINIQWKHCFGLSWKAWKLSRGEKKVPPTLAIILFTKFWENGSTVLSVQSWKTTKRQPWDCRWSMQSFKPRALPARPLTKRNPHNGRPCAGLAPEIAPDAALSEESPIQEKWWR